MDMHALGLPAEALIQAGVTVEWRTSYQ